MSANNGFKKIYFFISGREKKSWLLGNKPHRIFSEYIIHQHSLPHCLINSQQLSSDVSASIWVIENVTTKSGLLLSSYTVVIIPLSVSMFHHFPPWLLLMCLATDRSDGKTELCGEMSPTVPRRMQGTNYSGYIFSMSRRSLVIFFFFFCIMYLGEPLMHIFIF